MGLGLRAWNMGTITGDEGGLLNIETLNLP